MNKQQSTWDAKLDTLSTQFSQIQNNLNSVTKQMQDLLATIIEEREDDDLEDLRKEMNIMKQSIQKMTLQSASNNQQDKEQEEVKKRMSKKVKYPQYFDLFIENGFESMEIIKEIRMNDLHQIGIDKLGHKIKIMKEIAILNQDTQMNNKTVPDRLFISDMHKHR